MTMDHYNDTSAYLRQHKEVLIRVMFLTFCQRTALFSVTYFVYKAFGLTGNTYGCPDPASVSHIHIRRYAAPARGMGISEHLFLTIFDPIFYGDLLLPAMVLSRGSPIMCSWFSVQP